jgi:UPF0755 protein
MPRASSPSASRRSTRWRALALGLLAGAIVVALAGGAWIRALWQPYKGYAEPERFVDVPRGAGVSTIADTLARAGIVRDRWSFRVAARLAGAERRLKAGEYRFDRPQSAVEVVARLARGDVFLRQLTFPEGLTIAEMARTFEEQGFGTAETFVAAAKSVHLVRDLDPVAVDLEGYLFPDTYGLPRSATATDLVDQMVRRFKAVWQKVAAAGPAAGSRSVREIVTLASLVEEETAHPDERAIVAGVYANRLRIGMGLQCDPTVIYALRRAGRYTGNLTRADLAFDSPYNTYRYAGLPPGPIASPGRSSIEAALAPAKVSYLYFVSRNDGSHVFSTTLAEHANHVRRHQVEYFRQGRAQRR